MRLLREGNVKTRKHHCCEWCDEKIDIGSMAYHRVYIWENEFRNGYMHTECKEAMDTVDYRELEEGWTPGDYGRGSSEPKDY